MRTFSRFLVALAAIILASDAFIHAISFNHAVQVIDSACSPEDYGALLKTLWLSNCLGAISLALLLPIIFREPALRHFIFLTAAALFALAFLQYSNIGNFTPAHLLVIAAVALVAGTGGCKSRDAEPNTAPTSTAENP